MSYLQVLYELFVGFQRFDPQREYPVFASNQDSFISNTNWNYEKPTSNMLQFEQQLLNRPVYHDFHPKGSKYDVATPPEQRYKYQADRLGHPQFLGTPFARLLKLESDTYNPTFVEQPFVAPPSFAAHPDLNFQQGEVLYENAGALQWAKFWQASTYSFAFIFGGYLPLNIAYKTSSVPEWATQGSVGPIAYVSPYGLDAYQLFIPMSAFVIYYMVYIFGRGASELGMQYATKASFSKDRELLFVKTISPTGGVEEAVYETAHLEILPPFQKSGVEDMSMQDEDGLWRVTCLNTNRQIVFYNEDKYWNRDLKDNFINGLLGMWDNAYTGLNRMEMTQLSEKLESEFRDSLQQKELPSHKNGASLN